jgi:hypothetical protein
LKINENNETQIQIFAPIRSNTNSALQASFLFPFFNSRIINRTQNNKTRMIKRKKNGRFNWEKITCDEEEEEEEEVGGELVGKRSENFCVSLSLKACILIWKR